MNIRDSRGQALVMTLVFLTVLLGSAAMSLDVGSWYHSKRQLQAKADAAALAGAQALPESTADAQSLAVEYADKNGGVLDPANISFSSDITIDPAKVTVTSNWQPGDDVTVQAAYPYTIDLFGVVFASGDLHSKTTERVE